MKKQKKEGLVVTRRQDINKVNKVNRVNQPNSSYQEVLVYVNPETNERIALSKEVTYE